MTDYRMGIGSVLQTYGSNPLAMVNAFVALIETALENERARLKAEIAAQGPTCANCKQELGAEMRKVELEIRAAGREEGEPVIAKRMPQYLPRPKKRKVSAATKAKMKAAQQARRTRELAGGA
jgi:hypothetical protein